MKRALIVSCILLLITNLSMFAEQPEELFLGIPLPMVEPPRNIALNILLIAGGFGVMYGGVSLMVASFSFENENAACWSFMGGLLLTGAGSGLFVLGSWGLILIPVRLIIQHWKEKKVGISLQIQGPDVVLGKRLGGISLAYSY